jgi:hypothetical protein
MKIVDADFQKMAILCFEAHLKGPCFWSLDVSIHQTPTCVGQTREC